MKLEDFTTEQRVQAPHDHIDPGLINRRLVLSTFGAPFREVFDRRRRPGHDHLSELQNDHLLVDMALHACRTAAVPSLGALLHDPRLGTLFCSTEKIRGDDSVYKSEHARLDILVPYETTRRIFLEFHTKHIVADTGRLELSQESVVSIVAGIHSVSDTEVVARPLITGAPTYDHPNNRDLGVDLTWEGWSWYEIFAHDIRELERSLTVPRPQPEEWLDVMRVVPEADVKRFLCEILADVPRKDWGGELDDHFSAAVHLGTQRVTAAFLLKGPAHFREMTMDLLGKRADQIFRLAQSPAQLLVVQHCHQIGEAVRATLRAFAVIPHNPRRYCLIDGADTFRILKAYGKL